MNMINWHCHCERAVCVTSVASKNSFLMQRLQTVLHRWKSLLSTNVMNVAGMGNYHYWNNCLSGEMGFVFACS
jgi:hypothetical protein